MVQQWAGWTWWLSVVANSRSPLREGWIVASLVFVAVSSVFCGVTAVDDPAGSIGLVSVVVTGLGMVGLFFIPAAGSRQLPDVCRRAPTRRTGPDGPGAARL
jgi:threonine dehydrogenase-like Zn-dependent dehydrogenase